MLRRRLLPLALSLLIAGSASYAGWRSIDLRSAGAIGLGLLFVFTGIGHFALTEPMARMLPPWVPARVPLIYLSGLLEFAIAIGFFVPKTRRLAGWVARPVVRRAGSKVLCHAR